MTDLQVEPTSGTDSGTGLYEKLLERPVNAWAAVAAVVVLALLLRLPTMLMGLWFDECLTLTAISVPDIPALIQGLWCNSVDWHPPFYYICLFGFVKVFGPGELGLRSFSLFCGLLLIPLIYWLGKIVHSRSIGLLAGYFCAVSYFSNYMSCQAMPYSTATLIVAIVLISFCKLTDKTNTKRLATFATLVISGAALCYTEFSSIPLMAALSVATVVLYVKERFDSDSPSPQVFENFKLRTAALFLGCLTFVPWIPSLLYTKATTTDLVKTPVSMYPNAFAHNVLQMLPIPLIIGYPLVQLGLLVLIVHVALNWKKLRSEYRPDRIRSLIKSVPSNYLVLFWVVFVPSCILGIFTPFYMGYFRYTYCYSPAGWILLAMMFHKFVQARSLRFQKIFVPTTLASMLALNALYLCWFDSRPQSGLRPFATDAIAGKYEDCTILIAPSFIALTLNFYLSPEQCTAHNISVRGFPCWNDPGKIELHPKNVIFSTVEETEAFIDDLPKQGRKLLAVVMEPESTFRAKHINDKVLPSTLLRERIERKYKKLSTKEYIGVTETVDVTIYQLM